MVAVFRLRRPLRRRRQIVLRGHYNTFADLWQENPQPGRDSENLDPLPGCKFLFFKGRG